MSMSVRGENRKHNSGEGRKSVLITGASSGIGRALAFEMAGHGYRLALTARRYEVLQEVQEAIRSRYPDASVVIRSLDVADYEAVFTAVAELSAELGGLDMVVANAGVGYSEQIGRGAFEEARKTIDINLTGAMATMDAALQLFLERGSGHIVGVSSVAGFRGLPGSSAYCASKAGLAVYMQAMRAELLQRNIDVTILYPGFIDTPINERLPHRPFVISAERGARHMRRLIERKVRSATVPVFPWAIVSRLLKLLPTRIISRMSAE